MCVLCMVHVDVDECVNVVCVGVNVWCECVCGRTCAVAMMEATFNDNKHTFNIHNMI